MADGKTRHQGWATQMVSGLQMRIRGIIPRSLLGQQMMLLAPSVLFLLFLFSAPRVYRALTSQSALSSSGRSSNGSFASASFSSALSLRFPTALATDDTLTSGHEDLQSLLLGPIPNISSSSSSSSSSSLPSTPATDTAVAAAAPGGDAAGARIDSQGKEGEGEGEVVKAALIDVDMKGLTAATAEERRNREGELSNEPTKCSCFTVKNSLCCSQVLCLCGPLCWNGHQLVAQVKHGASSVECVEPGSSSALKVDGDVLKPFKCGELLSPGKRPPLEEVLEEGGFRGLGRRDVGWLGERRHAATWRLGAGATFLRRLDVRAASDAAAFAGALFPLLLLNNATAPALLTPSVSHLLLPRDKFFLAVAQEHGPEGLLAHLLELLVRSALQPLGLGSGGYVVPEWHRQRVIQDEAAPEEEQLLGGVMGGSGTPRQKHVEYERAWDTATESAPLCIERALLPGTLQGLVYPNNTAQAEAFQAQALRFLGLEAEPPMKGQVRLLFIRRADASDRVLESESEQLLMGLLQELGYARIEVLDVGAAPGGGEASLSLPQVVKQIQGADVIVGLHGSGLVHAGVFLRPGTPLIEIVPHHLFFTDVQVLVASSGGLFLQHMLLPSPSPPPGPSASRGPSTTTGITTGTPMGGTSGSLGGGDVVDFEKWDKEYSGHTLAHCMNSRLNYKCRHYFMRDRPIQITAQDALDLKVLLGLAKHFAETSIGRGLAEAQAELGRQCVTACKSAYIDLGFSTTDWLFNPLSGAKCVLKRTRWKK